MELQEAVVRGRVAFAGAPERLKVFQLVNGRNSASMIARHTKRSVSSVLNDLKKLRDLELIDIRRDKEGNTTRYDGSVVYEKTAVIRQIPLRYFLDSKAPKAMVVPKATRSPARQRLVESLRVPPETEILDICRHGEDQTFEFKGPGTDVRKITKEIAAFLHTPQGGIIFYGVQDDGSIAGTDVARQKFDQQLQNSIRNTVSPSPSIEVRSTNVLGTEITLIVVPPWNGKDIYFYEGRVYVRKGTNVFEAKPEEVKSLHQGKPIV